MLIFVHIPKTAGLTMNQILAWQYGRDSVWETNLGPQMWFPELSQFIAFRFSRLPAEKQARIRVLKGHMSFGMDRYLPQPVAYFTLMREPVDRVLSHYYFIADWKNKPGDMSLYEHIAARIKGNLQTRMMAAPYDNGIELQPDELLARAKQNLRACAVVGLTERFDETVLLLRKKFGWRWPLYINNNVNGKRPSRAVVPAEILERLAADNVQDAVLYEYAQELFAEQVRQYGSSFERDLRIFRICNSAWLWWSRLLDIPRRAFNMFDRLASLLFGPIYRTLSKWGGLQNLLPYRFRPRLVELKDLGEPVYCLYVGKRVVGRYCDAEKRWEIYRPWCLFVDVAALPAPKFSTRKEADAERYG